MSEQSEQADLSDLDPEQPAAADATPVIDADVPEADALEQHATLTDTVDTPPSELDPEQDADPADVQEQRRVVPTDDDEVR